MISSEEPLWLVNGERLGDLCKRLLHNHSTATPEQNSPKSSNDSALSTTRKKTSTKGSIRPKSSKVHGDSVSKNLQRTKLVKDIREGENQETTKSPIIETKTHGLNFDDASKSLDKRDGEKDHFVTSEATNNGKKNNFDSEQLVPFQDVFLDSAFFTASEFKLISTAFKDNGLSKTSVSKDLLLTGVEDEHGTTTNVPSKKLVSETPDAGSKEHQKAVTILHNPKKNDLISKDFQAKIPRGLELNLGKDLIHEIADSRPNVKANDKSSLKVHKSDTEFSRELSIAQSPMTPTWSSSSSEMLIPAKRRRKNKERLAVITLEPPDTLSPKPIRRFHSVGQKTTRATTPDNDHVCCTGRTLSVDRLSRKSFETSRSHLRSSSRSSGTRRRSLSIEQLLVTLTTTTETTIIRHSGSSKCGLLSGHDSGKNGMEVGSQNQVGVEADVGLFQVEHEETDPVELDFQDGRYGTATNITELGELSNFTEPVSTEDAITRPGTDFVDEHSVGFAVFQSRLNNSDQSHAINNRDLVEMEDEPKNGLNHISLFTETLTGENKKEEFILIGKQSEHHPDKVDKTNFKVAEENLLFEHQKSNNVIADKNKLGDVHSEVDLISNKQEIGDSLAKESSESQNDLGYWSLGKVNGTEQSLINISNQDFLKTSDEIDSLAGFSEADTITSKQNSSAKDNQLSSDVLNPSISNSGVVKQQLSTESNPLSTEVLLREMLVNRNQVNEPVSSSFENDSRLSDLNSKESSNYDELKQPFSAIGVSSVSSETPMDQTDSSSVRQSDDFHISFLTETLPFSDRSFAERTDGEGWMLKGDTPVYEFSERDVQNDQNLVWKSSDIVSAAVLHEYAEVVWFYKNYFLTVQLSGSSEEEATFDPELVLEQRSAVQAIGGKFSRSGQDMVHFPGVPTAPRFTWTWRLHRDLHLTSSVRGDVTHTNHVTTLNALPVTRPVERFHLINT